MNGLWDNLPVEFTVLMLIRQIVKSYREVVKIKGSMYVYRVSLYTVKQPLNCSSVSISSFFGVFLYLFSSLGVFSGDMMLVVSLSFVPFFLGVLV